MRPNEQHYAAARAALLGGALMLAPAAAVVLVLQGRPPLTVVVSAAVGVGLAVVGAAAESRAGARVEAVSLCWSLGWLVPQLVGLSRSAALLLVVVAAGRDLGHPRRAALVLMSAVLLLPGLGAAGAAVLLALAAVVVATDDRGAKPRAVRAAVILTAGQAAAAVLPVVLSRIGAGALAYGVGLVWSAALLHPSAARARLLETLRPGPETLTGSDPFQVLTAVLQEALGDDSLAVETARNHVEGAGARTVNVDGRPWAVVVSSRGTLDDEVTWLGVEETVAQVGRHRALLDAERQRAADIRESRSRVVRSADEERAAVATALRGEVASRLTRAQQLLQAMPDLAQELAGARAQIDALLAGFSPTTLGGGQIVPQLEALAGRSSVPVDAEIASLCADEATETAVWTVVAEGLTNAWKHARAELIQVRVAVADGSIRVDVVDDGQGGADPDGLGLQGLADRVAASGGRLTVADEHPGTRVTAHIPARVATRAPAPSVEAVSS